MTPAEFKFKLSIPSDPALADVVTDLIQHAIGYAGMTEDAGAAFVTKVKAATAAELGGDTPHCPIVIAATDGELRVTIGSQTISQPISA